MVNHMFFVRISIVLILRVIAKRNANNHDISNVHQLSKHHLSFVYAHMLKDITRKRNIPPLMGYPLANISFYDFIVEIPELVLVDIGTPNFNRSPMLFRLAKQLGVRPTTCTNIKDSFWIQLLDYLFYVFLTGCRAEGHG